MFAVGVLEAVVFEFLFVVLPCSFLEPITVGTIGAQLHLFSFMVSG